MGNRTKTITKQTTMIRSATLFAWLVLGAAVASADDDWECPADRIPELHQEAKLHKDLFCAYDFGDLRPVKDHKTTIRVQVRFAVKYISFDPLEETFNLHSWVAIAWTDEFLTWEPKNYGDIKEIQVESNKLWTPRMALFNADASMYNSDMIETTCLVASTGLVKCVPHLIHSGICRTSLRQWPYDEQNCTLYFGSWMHTGEQVNFTFYDHEPVVLDNFQNGPGWKLLAVKHTRLPGQYSGLNTTYPMLKYTFALKRVAAGPAAIVVVPAAVIILLTLMSLLLDVKNNVRLVMICFSLYGHFIFLTEIGYNIPKHSADTPIILLFLRDSMIITLVGICETLFLMSLRRRVEPAPTWVVSVNRLISSGPGKYVVFTEFDPSDAAGEVKVLTEDRAEESSQAIVDWIQFANILNSALFIIATLTYLILIIAYVPYGSVSADNGDINNM